MLLFETGIGAGNTFVDDSYDVQLRLTEGTRNDPDAIARGIEFANVDGLIFRGWKGAIRRRLRNRVLQ